MHDLEFTVSVADQVKSVTQQPDGKELYYKQNGSEVSADIPRLDCHAMVVIELYLLRAIPRQKAPLN